MQIELADIRKYIDGADNILLTSHIHPDGDAIGSCLAMYHVLKGMGKEVQMVIDDHVPDIYDILPGFEKIQRYEGQPLEADLVVLLDARPGREGRVCSSVSAPVLNIDHHASNDMRADYAYVEPEASAAAEVLYRLIREWGIALTGEVASCLYAGIATDTGFFRFDNTHASSLEIAAELVRLGAKPHVLADAVATKKFEDIQCMARALETAELFHGGRVVGVFLDKELKDLELTDDLIDMIRFTKGVDIAFLLKYEAEDTCRVRMRSRFADVSRVLEPLGGGGHAHAAGCTLRMSMETARETLIKVYCLTPFM